MMTEQMFTFQRNALAGALCDPLCEEYKELWRKAGDDKAKLVKLALRQQSIPYIAHYCRNGCGLDKDYVLREFADYINGYTVNDADGVDGYKYGLYAGLCGNETIVLDKDVSHFMWCETDIAVPKCACPNIYASNGSAVRLSCVGFNSVRVNLFDESRLVVYDCDETCDVTVYKYGDACKVERGMYCLSKKIKEHEKTLRL